MRAQGAPGLRRLAALGAAGVLAASALAGLPGARAKASVPVPSSPAAASDAVLTTIPADATFTLSPQLAAALGRTTVDAAGLRALRTAARPGLPGEKTPAVGTTLLWPALDDVNRPPTGLYLKPYTLRGVGQKVEVWVASGKDDISVGTAFPAGDCRNAVPNSTDVTDAQVAGLIREFDQKMFPKETEVFSTPPDRAGTSTLPGLDPLGVDFAGDGDKTVTLVDNVRDANFYEFPDNRSYVAGFFAPIFNELTDRNVMTIDAFDWLHRTGADPKSEPNSDVCKSRPAFPRLYEGVFAHEWQHLLERYQDAGEVPWLNEGLSMIAETLVGYAETTRTVHQTNAQRDLLCFNGFGTIEGPSNPNPVACGGPQNSLTTWGDEGQGSEILADYGNARSFMLFLLDRYGAEFLGAVHKDAEHYGLGSVQAALDRFAGGVEVSDVLHDFQLSTLVDRYLDDPRTKISGVARGRVSTKSLHSTVNLKNPATHAAPGAAPNGADYVLLKKGGKALAGSALRSVTFTGDRVIAGDPEANAGDIVVPVPDGLPIPGIEDTSAAVDNWHVSLVGIDVAGRKVLVSSRDKAFSATWTAAQLKEFAAYPTVVAVISHDNSDELDLPAEQYARYALKVDGTEQRGG